MPTSIGADIVTYGFNAVVKWPNAPPEQPSAKAEAVRVNDCYIDPKHPPYQVGQVARLTTPTELPVLKKRTNKPPIKRKPRDCRPDRIGRQSQKRFDRHFRRTRHLSLAPRPFPQSGHHVAAGFPASVPYRRAKLGAITLAGISNWRVFV